jgi:hypothetical protein
MAPQPGEMGAAGGQTDQLTPRMPVLKAERHIGESAAVQLLH